MWLVLKYLQATLILQIGNATFVNNPKLKNLKLDSNKLSGSVTLTFSDDMAVIEEILLNGLLILKVLIQNLSKVLRKLTFINCNYLEM